MIVVELTGEQIQFLIDYLPLIEKNFERKEDIDVDDDWIGQLKENIKEITHSLEKAPSIAMGLINTGFIDAPIQYVKMLKRFAWVLRQKHAQKGFSHRNWDDSKLGIKHMMNVTREEFAELHSIMNPDQDSRIGIEWWRVEQEANHLALASLLVADIARILEAL